MFLLVPADPGSPGQMAVKRLCVCVCVCVRACVRACVHVRVRARARVCVCVIYCDMWYCISSVLHIFKHSGDCSVC